MTSDTPPDTSALASCTLEALPLVILDCQATASTPEKGQIVDLAWGLFQASMPLDSLEIHASLVALEPGHRLPRQVAKLTGLSTSALKGAPTLKAVHAALHEDVVRRCDTPHIPLAHYARYERPLLAPLLATHPCLLWEQLLCTHDISRRLFPGLPRKGLRAMAGFLGSHLPPHKRSEVHVQGTAYIWQELVGLLDQEAGVRTYADLLHWLSTASTARPATRQYAVSAQTRLALPEVPGVYRFLSRHGDVLYVGKATSLKQRVNSYYRGKRGQGEQKLEMVTRAWEIDVTPMQTQLEACLLEADEIKKHVPPYNQMLQAQGRQVGFTQSLLAGPWGPAASAQLGAGPFGRPELIEELRLIVALLRGEVDPGTGLQLFWRLEDLEVLSQGLLLWREQAAALVAAGFGEAELMAYGQLLWDQMLARRAARAAEAAERALLEGLEAEAAEAAEAAEEQGDKEADEEEEAPKEQSDFVWTPGGISRGVDSIIRSATRHVRRSHFLHSLMDATLVWSPLHAPEAPLRALWLRRGQVAGAQDVARVEEVPSTWLEHEHGAGVVDLATYDRLSVLVGQLHRLVKHAQVVWLHTPERVWQREELARHLLGL